MRLELPLIIVVVALILVDGCGARGGNMEASLTPEHRLIPGDQKSESETPAPVVVLPLDIRIDSPDAPEEIRRPSPPIPRGSPYPESILDRLFKGPSK